jgi:DNA polymerase-3 subunit epsilon
MTTKWIDGELLAFDLETTGIDKFEDVPVSFALVWFDDHQIVRSRAELVNPEREIPAGASAVHGISTERAMAEGMPMVDAVSEVANALLDASRRGVPVVGFNLQYDLTMIDARLRALGRPGLLEAGWQGPVLDPLIIERKLYSKYERSRLSDVCGRYGVINEAAHDASGDAIASVRVLEEQAKKFTQMLATGLPRMTEVQRDWHEEWAADFHDYRLTKFGDGLLDDEFDWPIAGQKLFGA